MPYGSWCKNKNNEKEYDFVVDDGITETVPVKLIENTNNKWKIVPWDMPDDLLKDRNLLYNDFNEAKAAASVKLNRLFYNIE